MQGGDTALGGDLRAGMRMRDATLEDLASIVEDVLEVPLPPLTTPCFGQ